jgi:PiT family inorganic phosphate transporter
VVIVAAGPGHVVWGFELTDGFHLKGVAKIVGALFLSPILGFFLGGLLHRIMVFALRAAKPSANKYLRAFQWLTTAALAFSHGTNDAQKGMGVIAMILVLGGVSGQFYVPFWVILASATAITIGTLTGGWRIVRTLGFGIYKVRPIHALDAQLASAGVILAASALGAPVSTTQVVSTAIMGVGTSERPKSVHWGTAKHIFGTWLITIPGAASVSIGIYGLIQLAGKFF